MDNYREIFSQLDLKDCFDESTLLDPCKFYFKLYQNIPAVNWVYNIDKLKAFDFIKQEYAGSIQKILTESSYCDTHKKQEVDNAFFLLGNERIIKIGYSAVSIYTTNNDEAFVKEVT